VLYAIKTAGVSYVKIKQ